MPAAMREDVDTINRQILELKKKRAEAVQALPPEPVKDYEFQGKDGAVSLSQLFGAKADLIVVHNMDKGCKYCTLWADGFAGLAKHLEDRAGFVVSSPNDVNTQAEFAASRHWPFRMVSVKGTTFAKDMGYERSPGEFWPGISVFHKYSDGSIVRTGTTQLGPGDDFCGLWPMFDMLKGGPGNWEPKYTYA